MDTNAITEIMAKKEEKAEMFEKTAYVKLYTDIISEHRKKQDGVYSERLNEMIKEDNSLNKGE